MTDGRVHREVALGGGAAVAPADVAADGGGLFGVVGVVAAVEGEVAQGGELGFDPVQPAGVGGGEHELDVVGPAPVAHFAAAVGGEVVQHDVQPLPGPAGAQDFEEGQDLLPALAAVDAVEHLAAGKVEGSQRTKPPLTAASRRVTTAVTGGQPLCRRVGPRQLRKRNRTQKVALRSQAVRSAPIAVHSWPAKMAI